MAGFRLLGERTLDLSPRGALVAADARAALGEEVVLSLRAPGTEELWLDVEAEVARLVHGYRYGDPGYGLGLRFTYIESSAQRELLARLAGCPPPVPRRRLKTAAQRAADYGPVAVAHVKLLRGAAPRGAFCA